MSLDMDFQLYKYLKSLLIGRSFCNYDSERNVYYSNFVETLVQYCQSEKDIRILSCDNTVGLKKDNTLLEMINYV